MSWLKSAFSRAAEAAGAGGKSIGPNLDRAKEFAGSVVHSAGSAVAGGARAVLERASSKHYNNFKHAVKRLDEVSLNVRGEERTAALQRWLAALKELSKELGTGKDSGLEEASPQAKSDEGKESDSDAPSQVSAILFHDPETSSEPLTFRDVFLRSNALENIAVSMILEPPTDEEVRLVLQMFGLCLCGGPELHHALLSGIQDLGKSISHYSELMLKRDDLLRMAADAVTGLKLSAEAERLEVEAVRLQADLASRLASLSLKEQASGKAEAPPEVSEGIFSDVPEEMRQASASTQALLQSAVRLVELSHRKEALLLQSGDSHDIRTLKVEKMRLLADELASQAKEFKATISASRQQKSEAMAYRVTKAEEVQEAEKVISAEMQVLQKRREELEAQLKEVVAAIDVQTKKHLQLQEEKEAFDAASTDLVALLATQEEELSALVKRHSTEAGVAGTWRSFLEDTWLLQSNSREGKEKAVRASAEKTHAHFWLIAIGHLVYRQEELDALLIRLKMYMEELAAIRAKKADLEKKGMDGVIIDITSSRKKIEQKYVETEAKVRNVLVAVESVKADVKITMETIPELEGVDERKRLEELLASLDTHRRDFDAIPRPKLIIEMTSSRQKKQTSKSSESWHRGPLGNVDLYQPGNAVRATVQTEASTEAGTAAQPVDPMVGTKSAETMDALVDNNEVVEEKRGDAPETSQKLDKAKDHPENADPDIGTVDGWDFDQLEVEDESLSA